MSNNPTEYKNMVTDLAKNGQEILDEMTPNKAHAVHMAMGVSGEAGEILDVVKKYVMYNKPLGRTHLIEELGDLEFYLEGLRQATGITREEVLDHNLVKLLKGDNARYKEGTFSNEAAQLRRDKQ
jgi:NTP pyrophosphatase (non-canonical NTP hydrolase)